MREISSLTPKLGMRAVCSVVGDGTKVRSRFSRQASPQELQEGDGDQRNPDKSSKIVIRRSDDTMRQAFYEKEYCEVALG